VIVDVGVFVGEGSGLGEFVGVWVGNEEFIGDLVTVGVTVVVGV
jgi:hypothetical protein